MEFVCISCGHLGAAEGDCPNCPDSTLLDRRRPDVIDLMRDTESRIRDRRNDVIRWVSVVLAILIGLGVNFIPGFEWPIRLPLFAHWFIFVIALGLAFIAFFERFLPAKKRFPFLDE